MVNLSRNDDDATFAPQLLRTRRRPPRIRFTACYLLYIADVVAASGVPRETLFAGFDEPVDDLLEAEAEVSFVDLVALIERAMRLTGDDALAVKVGASVPAVAFAGIGLAAVTAPTVEAALEVLVRSVPTRVPALRCELIVSETAATVVFHEGVDFAQARGFVLTAAVTALWHAVRSATGEDVTCQAALPTAPSRVAASLAPYGVVPSFTRGSVRVTFDLAVLSLPLRMGNAVVHRRALGACGGAHPASEVPDVRQAVEALVLRPHHGVRRLTEVAAELRISERTLKRRLADEGVTFSEILEEQQQRRALLLLRMTELSVPEIGARVGYGHPSNFSRAFQRWVGCLPTKFRHLRAVQRRV